MRPIGYYLLDDEAQLTGDAVCRFCTGKPDKHMPIYGPDEADTTTFCVACGALIPLTLTAHGLEELDTMLADSDDLTKPPTWLWDTVEYYGEVIGWENDPETDSVVRIEEAL